MNDADKGTRVSVVCGACEACRASWGRANGKVCRSPQTIVVPPSREFEVNGVTLTDLYGED